MDNPIMQLWALANGAMFALMILVTFLTFFGYLQGTECLIGCLFTLTVTSSFIQGVVEQS